MSNRDKGALFIANQAYTSQNKFCKLKKRSKLSINELFNTSHTFSLTSGAGSSIEENSTYVILGTKSLKMTSVTAYCQIDKSVTLDLSAKKLVIDFYVPDITKFTRIDVLLEGVATWSKYFSIAIPSTTIKQGWNSIGVSPLVMSRVGGASASDLATITKIRLKLINVIEQECSVYVDSIRILEENQDKAMVTLTFDDGHNSVFSIAKPIMDEYSFVGTAYVIPSQLAPVTANRMSLEQLKTLQSCGWDIASHTWSHEYFTSDNLTESEKIFQLSTAKKWLIDNGFHQGSEHLATPGGQYVEADLDLIKKYYTTHRTVKEFNEFYPPIDSYNLKIKNMWRDVSLVSFQTWVDKAIESKDWIIIMYHYFNDPATASTEILPSSFQDQMDYLQANISNLDIVTMSEASLYY